MDKKVAVKEIIKLVGDDKNIAEVSHCFTRLRFKLIDRNIVDDENLKKVQPVMGLIDRGGELQVVIGNEVSEYYAEAKSILGDKSSGSVDEKLDNVPNKKKLNLIDKISEIASAIFIPIIGALAACGTLQGIISLLTFLNVLTKDSGTYIVLYAIAESIFYFLPFFLAYTAANHFGGKAYISMIIAGTMMYPEVMAQVTSGNSMNFVGIPLLFMNYSKTVFPIIVASWLASVVEKKLRKVIPDILKMIFVPMITLLIVAPLTLLVVGPVLTKAMALVTLSVQTLYNFTPTITGAIVGGVWQLLVFFGISKAFIPIFTSDFSTFGYSYFGAITFFVACMGQTGAVLGIALKSKSKNVKSVAYGATVSGFFGITEPALFGLNVPAKKPFLIGSISAVIGAVVSSLLGGKLYTLATGVLGIPALINPNSGIDMGFYGVLLGSAITLVLAVGLTYKFGWTEENDKNFKL